MSFLLKKFLAFGGPACRAATPGSLADLSSSYVVPPTPPLQPACGSRRAVRARCTRRQWSSTEDVSRHDSPTSSRPCLLGRIETVGGVVGWRRWRRWHVFAITSRKSICMRKNVERRATRATRVVGSALVGLFEDGLEAQATSEADALAGLIGGEAAFGEEAAEVGLVER